MIQNYDRLGAGFLFLIEMKANSIGQQQPDLFFNGNFLWKYFQKNFSPFIIIYDFFVTVI